MADIVASLFGVTPESYQQQQSAAEDQRALALAQLTPFQRAEFNINRGAYNLGQAVGGALGAQDPQLQLISARNAIAKQINYNDPASIQQGVQQLAQAGDTVGAMQLATVGRDLEYKQAQTAQARAAANRERQQGVPPDVLKAQRIGEITVALQSPDLDPAARSSLEAQLRSLQPEKTPTQSAQLQLASDIEATQSAVDTLSAQPQSPERDAALRRAQIRLDALNRQLPKEAREDRFGVDRESVSMELYNKPFAQLTQAERTAVNARLDLAANNKAKSGAAQFVLPGQKELVDIPAFRAKVQATIRPQLDTLTATEQALQSIEDSIKSNNFVSFNAARTQLARALGDSQLSRRDIEQAGGDPSLLGGFYDATSRLFTGTPSVDTQNKIRSTLNAIQTVARNRGKTEVEQQLKIALRSPGYSNNADTVREALTFPELAARPAAAKAPIYARNPTTGERIMSTDGGATWAPAPAAR